jgi:hypothetical protein
MRRKAQVRVVTRASDGKLRIREFPSSEPLVQIHTQIGVDDCSNDRALHGLPVFRELVGPIPGRGHVARYETPEVFEMLTKKWCRGRDHSRRRRTKRDMDQFQGSGFSRH